MVSASVQRAVVSAAVHSVLIEILLYGIYTAVYAGTMCIYLSRSASTSIYILAFITSLFTLNSVRLICNWITVTRLMKIRNAHQNSLEAPYFFLVYSFGLEDQIGNICGYLLIVIADGLMIWRCYKVWGNSWRIISLPVLLFLAEIALYITSAVMGHTSGLHSLKVQHQLDRLEATGAVIGAATTVLSVLLIFYCIYTGSQKNALPCKGRRYMNILYLLTKSSALYAIGLVLCAIPVAIPLTESNTRWQQSWTWYSEPIFSFSSGMAPTLVVVCVALAADDEVVQEAALEDMTSSMFHAGSTDSARSVSDD